MARCKTSKIDFKNQARILKALGNESRLRIVDHLSKGECSPGELTQLVGLDQSTVSKHLSVLRASGIVDSRRDGSTVVYELLTPCVVDFFRCAGEVLTQKP